MRNISFFSIITTACIFAIDASAQISNPIPPKQTCTAEQVRAAERYWFFGDGVAMDFGIAGSNAPTITRNTPISQPNVQEGSTVVTDTKGVLQFWVGTFGSNDLKVFGSDSQPMPNGSGLTGSQSAVQNVTSFPSLSTPGIYYVVSTTGEGASNGAYTKGTLHVSQVDMRANNGHGEVVSRDVIIESTVNLASEALTAVPNSEGTGYWILTTEFGSNNLVAVNFNEADPAVSPVVKTQLSQPIGALFGNIYANKKLDRLVVLSGGTYRGSPNPNQGNTPYTADSHAFLLSFNAQTGLATEKAAWKVPVAGRQDPNIGYVGGEPGQAYVSAYNADFSPNGEYIYVSQVSPARLWRYRITDENSVAIASSEEFVGITSANDGVNRGGAVKRGPDGAMWLASEAQTTLTRIENPDATSNDLNFSFGNVSLPSGTSSRFGLPQTVTGCPKALEPDALPSFTSVPSAPFLVNTPQQVEISLANNDGATDHVRDGTATITLPTGLTLVPNSTLPQGCTPTSASTIACDLATLGPIAASASVSVTLQVTASTSGDYEISVTVTGVTDEVNTGDNTASATIKARTAAQLPDATPTLSGPTAPFAPNTEQIVNANIGNAGALDAIEDGTATITLPPNVTLAPNSTLPAGCTATSASAISCDLATLGPIAPNGSANIPMQVIASAPGNYDISVIVTDVAGEVNTGDNTASATIKARIDAQLQPDAKPTLNGPLTPFAPNTEQTVNATIGNAASLDAIEDGTATITLPPNVTLVPNSTLPAGCTATSASTISCDLATLGPIAPNGSANIPMQVIASALGNYDISLTVTAVTGEVNTGDNTATITMQVRNTPTGQVSPVPTLSPGSMGFIGMLLAAFAVLNPKRRKNQK